MTSNIRVFVQWRDATVFAGEEIECTITFKNIASDVPPDRSPNRRQNGFLASIERQQRRDPALRPPSSKPSLSRNSSFSTRIAERQSRSHRPALSVSTTATAQPLDQATRTASTSKGHAHQRSLSIVSLGSPDPSKDGLGKSAPTSSRRSSRSHNRSASLQVISGRKTTSPFIGSPRAQSATQPSPLFGVLSPSTPSESPREAVHQRPGRRASGYEKEAQLAGPPRKNSTTYPKNFRFPASPDASTTPSIETPSESDISSQRGHRPRPAIAQGFSARQEGFLQAETASPIARILSGSSMNGTPRSSGEFYSMSNNSTETLPSEYVSQPTARLLPVHSRSGSAFAAPRQKDVPETLIMGYAQIMGTFTLDGSLINQAPFEEVKRKGVVGGQGGGGVVGVEQKKRDSGLFGALGWGTIGESIGGLLGTNEPSSIREMRGIASSKTVPLLTTPQSILFIDLKLAPGESQSFRYSFTLPRGLPPTHKGRAIKVAYHLAIGTQRPGSVKSQQQVRHVDIPFRVFGSVTSEGEILGHDLMSPYVLLRDQARTGLLSEEELLHAFDKGKRRKQITSGSSDFEDYVSNLLHRPRDDLNAGLLSPTATETRRRSAPDEQISTMREAIDLAILRSNTAAFSSQSSNRFNIARSGRRVATIVLARPAYRLGETISAVIDLADADIPCYSVVVCLESSERIDPAISLRSPSSIYRATRKIHALFSENTLFARRLNFSPTVPPQATPEFLTSGINLEWKLRIEFVTPRLTADDLEDNIAMEEVLEEVLSDDRGTVLAAAQRLPCESFEVSVPVRIYGAVTGGVEDTRNVPLIV